MALLEATPARTTLLTDEPAQQDPSSESPDQLATEILKWIDEARRELIVVDFDLRNAWHLRRTADGRLTWVSDDEVLDQQPPSPRSSDSRTGS